MILPLEEREEILVVNDNKDLMFKLRDEVKKNFTGLWLLLYYNSVSEKYGLEVCNSWCGKLSEDKLNDVRFFVENFMLDNYSKYE